MMISISCHILPLLNLISFEQTAVIFEQIANDTINRKAGAFCQEMNVSQRRRLSGETTRTTNQLEH